MDKPVYSVPSMEEIAALPWNGYRVASLFAGGGGSSTGYRMAGFKVLYANEFVEAAAETYRTNASPSTVVDSTNVRELSAEELMARAGVARGELDVLDGSPPCSSFSTAGRREEKWGQVSKYSDTAQRTDDLFYEYARLVEGVQPRVFVAENVSGLVKGTAKGYFKAILARLRSCGYRVEARLLDAKWLGVPQQRQRLIFIGVREDLGLGPVFPKPMPFTYSVAEVLDAEVVWDPHGQFNVSAHIDRPVNTITTTPSLWQVRAHGTSNIDPETGQDLSFQKHAISKEWEKLGPGQGSRKYLSLIRQDPDRPSFTITAAAGGISAAVTHATEPRKFNLVELRALCSFPADFVLLGTFTQRWERLGRAVPPVMMRHIASTVRDEVLAKCAG